ncbi:hypothetical protein LOZ58_000792 [Ophidiomyces ophidiicola]|nr:hypothetical protein LOZ58_000792 [Ophidiomyces ophidiicola]
MSRISSEEQLNFLLSCVKNSNNGKVNFDLVAKECEIVSKGAAAKRYERLMKANGINPNGGGPAIVADGEAVNSGEATTPKKISKTPAIKTGTPKEPKNETPRKRKGKAPAAETPTKKAKPIEKTEEDEDSDENSIGIKDKYTDAQDPSNDDEYLETEV